MRPRACGRQGLAAAFLVRSLVLCCSPVPPSQAQGLGGRLDQAQARLRNSLTIEASWLVLLLLHTGPCLRHDGRLPRVVRVWENLLQEKSGACAGKFASSAVKQTFGLKFI